MKELDQDQFHSELESSHSRSHRPLDYKELDKHGKYLLLILTYLQFQI